MDYRTDTDTSHLHLAKILSDRAIKTLFQPIISVKQNGVFAIEALSRGLAKDGYSLIPPNLLFSLPQSENELLMLDRLCRERAIETFVSLIHAQPSLLIAINIDASIINSATATSNHLFEISKREGINPNNIIIEIIESRATDTDVLMEFVSYYRDNGFLIALDDVGTGHSNLDRIPLLKPDIIKIDRSLISDIDSIFHKREIVKALKQMASKVGTMILAEGVEKKDEALVCMEIGIDCFQGFYFGRPVESQKFDYKMVQNTIGSLKTFFKKHKMQKISEATKRARRHRSIAEMVSSQITNLDSSKYDEKIQSIVNTDPAIQCVYVLNLDGIQITDTFLNNTNSFQQRRFIYKPAPKNSDHSLKEYYLPLRAGLHTFTTESYISMATGRRCTTIAAFYRDREGAKNILCIDLDCD